MEKTSHKLHVHALDRPALNVVAPYYFYKRWQIMGIIINVYQHVTCTLNAKWASKSSEISARFN